MPQTCAAQRGLQCHAPPPCSCLPVGRQLEGVPCCALIRRFMHGVRALGGINKATPKVGADDGTCAGACSCTHNTWRAVLVQQVCERAPHDG